MPLRLSSENSYREMIASGKVEPPAAGSSGDPKAPTEPSEVNLLAFSTAIREFARRNADRTPVNREELVKSGMLKDPANAVSTVDGTTPYEFVRDGNAEGPDSRSILAYDPVPVKGGSFKGHFLVARKSRSIEYVSPEAFQTQLQSDTAQANLRMFQRTVVAYKEKTGSYPASLAELEKSGLADDASVLRSPGKDGEPYVYVRPLDPRMLLILAYDSKPVNGRYLYVYTNGFTTSCLRLEQLTRDFLPMQERRQHAGIGIPTPPPTRFGPEPTPVPPVSNVTVVDGKKLTVEWDVVGWAKEPNLAANHKFPKICQVIREVTKNRDTARVGVTYGPEAKAKEDEKYLAFKKSIKNFWVDECGIKLDSIKESKQKLQSVEYDRMNTLVAGQMGVSLLTVRDGRCVCYWFEGSSNCFTLFIEGLDQSKVKVEDLVPKP